MNDATGAAELPWTRGESLFLALLAVLSALYALPLFAGGEWFVSHEMRHALTRLAEFDFAVRGGRFPPRWADNLMAGHGYPLFNYFPPMSFMVAELFALLGASHAVAWKLAVVLFRFAGAAGMYGLLRHRCGRVGAAFGATLFLAAQYPASTLYVRGNLQEYAALNFWPLAFWSVDAVARRRSWRAAAVPAAAIAVGAFATCHMLTTYMAAFHLSAFGAFLLLRQRASLARGIAMAIATALLGGACGAFYLLPAVGELHLTRNAVLTDWTRVGDHFLAWWQLFRPSWGYGLSVAGTGDGMPLDLGIGLWVAVAAGIAAIAIGRRWSAESLFASAMFAATCFATTDLAAPLWSVWPMGEWLQFPWRLLIPATFWGCAFAATALGPVLERLAASPGGRLGVALACAVPCALVAPLLRPLFFWNEVPSYRAEELRRVMTNTMTGEYLPLAVDEWPARMSMRAVEIRETGHRFAADSAGASSYVALVEAPAGSRATFDVFDFPGWTVEIDGVPVETASAPPSGLIAWTFDEAGEHEVAVRFGDTPLRAAANGVSLVAWIGCLAWIGTAMRGRRYAEASANRAGENSAHEAQAGSS